MTTNHLKAQTVSRKTVMHTISSAAQLHALLAEVAHLHTQQQDATRQLESLEHEAFCTCRRRAKLAADMNPRHMVGAHNALPMADID